MDLPLVEAAWAVQLEFCIPTMHQALQNHLSPHHQDSKAVPQNTSWKALRPHLVCQFLGVQAWIWPGLLLVSKDVECPHLNFVLSNLRELTYIPCQWLQLQKKRKTILLIHFQDVEKTTTKQIYPRKSIAKAVKTATQPISSLFILINIWREKKLYRSINTVFFQSCPVSAASLCHSVIHLTYVEGLQFWRISLMIT